VLIKETSLTTQTKQGESNLKLGEIIYFLRHGNVKEILFVLSIKQNNNFNFLKVHEVICYNVSKKKQCTYNITIYSSWGKPFFTLTEGIKLFDSSSVW